MVLNIRNILVKNLLLQSHSGGGNHQFFFCRLGNGNTGQSIGHGFSGTGTSLNNTDRRIREPLAVIIHLDHTQSLSNLGDHDFLTQTGL